MPRFLSPAWVAAFNDALAPVDLSGAAGDGSLVASGGTFSVRQVVDGVPDGGSGPPGPVRTLLVVEGGRVSMVLDDGSGVVEPAVTVSLSYPDAAALSRGELPAAEALGTGRVRVRGDLSVLVAGQAVLAAAADHLAALAADTTY